MAKSYRSKLELMRDSAAVGEKEPFDCAPKTSINEISSISINELVGEAFKNLE